MPSMNPGKDAGTNASECNAQAGGAKYSTTSAHAPRPPSPTASDLESFFGDTAAFRTSGSSPTTRSDLTPTQSEIYKAIAVPYVKSSTESKTHLMLEHFPAEPTFELRSTTLDSTLSPVVIARDNLRRQYPVMLDCRGVPPNGKPWLRINNQSVSGLFLGGAVVESNQVSTKNFHADIEVALNVDCGWRDFGRAYEDYAEGVEKGRVDPASLRLGFPAFDPTSISSRSISVGRDFGRPSVNDPRQSVVDTRRSMSGFLSKKAVLLGESHLSLAYTELGEEKTTISESTLPVSMNLFFRPVGESELHRGAHDRGSNSGASGRSVGEGGSRRGGSSSSYWMRKVLDDGLFKVLGDLSKEKGTRSSRSR